MNIPDHRASTSKTSIVQTIFRILLGCILVYTGISHLTFSRIEFLAQVPRWVTLNGDLVVILSGIVEIILGISLVFLSKRRVAAGWLAALFFMLVFPGNISQYVNKVDGFGLNTDTLRFIRLFFQPVFILWALWSTGAWTAWRKSIGKKKMEGN